MMSLTDCLHCDPDAEKCELKPAKRCCKSGIKYVVEFPEAFIAVCQSHSNDYGFMCGAIKMYEYPAGREVIIQ